MGNNHTQTLRNWEVGAITVQYCGRISESEREVISGVLKDVPMSDSVAKARIET